MLSYLIVLTYAPYLRPRSRSTSSDRLIAGADLVEPLMLCHGDELWLYLAPQEPCPLPQASCEVLSLVTVAASWSTQKIWAGCTTATPTGAQLRQAVQDPKSEKRSQICLNTP